MFEVDDELEKSYALTKQQRENPQQPGPENSGKNAEKNNNQLNINMDANERLALYVCSPFMFLSHF
jgi:hypothetical protein